MQELGETREEMAWGVWRKAEQIAQDHKKDPKPFYIVFAAKTDPQLRGAVVNGIVASGGIRQTFRLSYDRPKVYIGQLVWYVNNALGDFQFLPELSPPPDIPLDPSMMSTSSKDQFSSVMDQGKRMNVLVS